MRIRPPRELEVVTSFKEVPVRPAVSIAVFPEEEVVALTIDGYPAAWPDEIGGSSEGEGPFLVPGKYKHAVNVELTFTATPQNLELLGTDPIEYRWNMGDGIVRYGEVVKHTYLTPNPDTIVRLLMTDSRGHRARAFLVMNLGHVTAVTTSTGDPIITAEAIVLG